MTPLAAMVEVEHASCRLGGKLVLDQLTLTVAGGEIVSILGPSGSGKTTALRLLAGFETTTEGSIRLRGRLVNDAAVMVVPEHRKLGLVQQDYALFPHLTVAGNVAFGLSGLSAPQRQTRVGKWLELVGLADKAQRMPHQLSGGEQQRVAIARALAPEPDLLLLDEPFSNLDAQLRKRLVTDLRALLKQHNVTAIMVTHDRHEALTLSDRIAVMKDGVLQQIGSNEDLLYRPANRFVAEVVGGGNWIPIWQQDQTWRCAVGALPSDDRPEKGHDDGYQLLLRRHDLLVDPASDCSATVLDVQLLDGWQQCQLRLTDDSEIEVLLPTNQPLQAKQTIAVCRAPSAPSIVFPAQQA